MKRLILPFVAMSSAVLLGYSWADSVAARALSFRQSYVFGDSLSDQGNVFVLTGKTLPPSPPYFRGRFSNGPVWVDSFNRVLGLTPIRYAATTQPGRPLPENGINFAFGGATSGSVNLFGSRLFGLQQQITAFTNLSPIKNPPILFTLWIGGNDYLSNPFQGVLRAGKVKLPAPQFVPQRTPTETIGNIVGALTTLAKSGAKTILVFNLPDLGKTPFGRSNPTLSAALTQLTQAHNSALKGELSTLKTKYPRTQFIPVDVNRLFDFVSNRPGLFKLNNVTEQCLNINSTPPTICANPEQYLFWDDVHPTKVGNQLIAKFAIASLAWPYKTIEPAQVLSIDQTFPEFKEK